MTGPNRDLLDKEHSREAETNTIHVVHFRSILTVVRMPNRAKWSISVQQSGCGEALSDDLSCLCKCSTIPLAIG